MTRIEKRSQIGRAVPKIDAPERATGRAIYIQDLELPRMLHGAILRADRVHARILSVDTARADRLPGVRAVLTAADIDNVPFGHGMDNTALKGERVRCIRDEIAAVAAESEAIAREAVSLIRVEYEDLPGIYDPVEALREGAPVIHDHRPDNIPMQTDYAQGDKRAYNQ